MMVVVVDLCGTLVRENTTRGFMAHLQRKRLSSWLTRIGLSRITGRVGRIVRSDLSRSLLIRSLRGISREILYHEAENYVEELMRHNLNSHVLQIIRERTSQGALLCLATASLDPIAASVARHFQFHRVISSKLEYVNKVSTGKLELDVRGNKWNNLRQQFLEIDHADEIIAITDNPEDQDLRVHATEFHWVSPNGELSEG